MSYRNFNPLEKCFNNSSNRQPEKLKVECESIGSETPSGNALWATVKCGPSGKPEELCFPLSQVHEIARSKEINKSYLMVTPWIASQKGLR